MDYYDYLYEASKTAAGIYFVYAIIGLIVAIVFGCITKKINENKGYDGGFAWGFWLGPIGLIVVCCRDAAYTPSSSVDSYEKRLRDNAVRQAVKAEMEKEDQRRMLAGKAQQLTRIRDYVQAQQLESYDGFFVVAERCESVKEVAQIWDTMFPQGDETIATMLREAVIAESVYINNVNTPQPKAAPSLPESKPQSTLEKENYDPNKDWICPTCGHKNIAFHLRCQKCGKFK